MVRSMASIGSPEMTSSATPASVSSSPSSVMPARTAPAPRAIAVLPVRGRRRRLEALLVLLRRRRRRRGRKGESLRGHCTKITGRSSEICHRRAGAIVAPSEE